MISQLLRTLIPARFRPIGYLEELTRQRSGGAVRQGPFQGMRYGDRSVGSAYIPKVLGIYERELNPVVARINALRLPLVIDVGSAEGYYAVGLATTKPQARVVAFETEAAGRNALAQLAALNGVGDRVEVRGQCELADLRVALERATRALVFCDAEGYEEVLLDPAAIPALARVYLAVETHDFLCPGVTDRLAARFEPTHRAERIVQTPRSREDFPYSTLVTKLLPGRYLDWAVDEWRPEIMSWLWLEPKHATGNGL